MQEMSYDHITRRCLETYDNPEIDALALLEALMDQAGVPMHDPVHHYIMPAVLLTVASRKKGYGLKKLRELLETAEERARKLLPGFCGWWGACGAAVGCGVFASVWTGASPKIENNWAQINQFTSRCLANVASVNGPRCCKRTSYLALKAAIPAARELFDADLGAIPEPVCTWSHFNNECRKAGCPFFKNADPDGSHAHLRQGITNLHGQLPD